MTSICLSTSDLWDNENEAVHTLPPTIAQSISYVEHMDSRADDLLIYLNSFETSARIMAFASLPALPPDRTGFRGLTTLQVLSDHRSISVSNLFPLLRLLPLLKSLTLLGVFADDLPVDDRECRDVEFPFALDTYELYACFRGCHIPLLSSTDHHVRDLRFHLPAKPDERTASAVLDAARNAAPYLRTLYVNLQPWESILSLENTRSILKRCTHLRDLTIDFQMLTPRSQEMASVLDELPSGGRALQGLGMVLFGSYVGMLDYSRCFELARQIETRSWSLRSLREISVTASPPGAVTPDAMNPFRRLCQKERYRFVLDIC
ncbi:hypothetical protein EXIGLDRAFT_830993 [Exidia glandulosa HHB12029]|uniref:Uncharacterized protein n=1 Tax=Exidia glandulosa HHB12029 TaxID=1314781 RepID=A0A165N387_EXIGL|nr:hypothetical protein EXIGLDRAFT_830993 [Exidia glandulosa HHB12029]